MTRSDGARMSLPALIAANAKRTEKTVKRYETTPKICLYCRAPLEYKKRRNNFCDHSCAARMHNRTRKIETKRHAGPAIGKRVCGNCSGPVRHGANWHCSHKCAQRARFERFIKYWKDGNVPAIHKHYRQIKRYMVETHGEKCSLCGWSSRNDFTGNIPIQMHHKDGDYTNMDEGNLQLLCPNCHSLTGNYGFRNKGAGRDQRRLWREKLRASLATAKPSA